MTRKVAFLRAINVGGHVVPMARLKTLFEELGLKDVETFIASGNVLFSSPKDPAALERQIEKHLHTKLGYEVKTFVRTLEEVAEIACYAPFPAARVKAARAFCVGFLAEPLDKSATAAFMALRSKDDEFHVNGREIYWLSKVGQGQSKFSNNAFEKACKVSTTFRGVNTIVKLTKKYQT
jgi:uncharacterized protein (DUF1697 family)